MKRNQQSLKANRRAKTRPAWEAQQRARKLELERAQREAATPAPFNESMAEIARSYIANALTR